MYCGECQAELVCPECGHDRTCVCGDCDRSISELTDGECDGIECDGPPHDTHGG